MTIILSEEELEFRDHVRRYARERIAPFAAERDRGAIDPQDIFEELGQMDALGITIPKKYSGLGLDRRYLVIAIEEIAYADGSVAGIFAGHYLGMEGFYLFGSEDIKEQYLVPMAKGACRAAFALTEANAGSDISRMMTRAVLNRGYYHIDGTKLFISSARECDVLILFAKTSSGNDLNSISAFAVPNNLEGIGFSSPLEKMGSRGEQAYEVVFDDVRIPESSLIGELGQGAKIALGVLNGSRIDSAAGANGIGLRALDLAVDYASKREQFGGAIRDFQSIQLMIGEIYTRVLAGRAITFGAASLENVNSWEFRRAASAAKYTASENAHFAVDTSLQIHGGYGYMKDSEIERLYRDIRVRRIFEGTSQIQLLTIAKTLYKMHDEGSVLH